MQAQTATLVGEKKWIYTFFCEVMLTICCPIHHPQQGECSPFSVASSFPQFLSAKGCAPAFPRDLEDECLLSKSLPENAGPP